MTFKQVQFIGMALCTTPGHLNSIGKISDEGKYLGSDDVEKDVKYRIELLTNTIKKTLESESINHDVNTLKVFVIPEFYFRGNKGAYYCQNSFDFFQEYIEPEIEKIGNSINNNWIFVLGSLLTSPNKIKKDIEPTKSLYNIGDHILDVYYKRYSKFLTKKDKAFILSEFLKQIDNRNIQNNLLKKYIKDKIFQDFLKCTLEYCDSIADIEVENYCYIYKNLLNSKKNKTIRILKKYKSKEDFILNSIDNNYTQCITKYREIPEKKLGEFKNSCLDEYSVFFCSNIMIGVDICLDHRKKRLLKHFVKNNYYLDIQIITSCGMSIYDSSVIAKNNGYVFICDGEYELKDKEGYDIAENGDNCHTLLKKVVNQVNPHEKNLKSKLSENIKTIDKIYINLNKKFFRTKQCQVHIYPSLSL